MLVTSSGTFRETLTLPRQLFSYETRVFVFIEARPSKLQFAVEKCLLTRECSMRTSAVLSEFRVIFRTDMRVSAVARSTLTGILRVGNTVTTM